MDSDSETSCKDILGRIYECQGALQKLRWRFAALCLGMTAILAFVDIIFLNPLFFEFQEYAGFRGVCMLFFSEVIFDTRMLLPILAPFPDDTFLMRCMLAPEATYFFVLRSQRLWELFAANASLWKCFSRSRKVWEILYIARGLIFGACATWATVQPTAQKLQKWMWFCFVQYAVLNTLQTASTAIYDSILQKVVSSEFGELLANILFLYLVTHRRTLQCLQAWLRGWIEAKGTLTSAASVAAMVGNLEPKQAVEDAKRRFRCISIDSISFDVVKDNTACPSLYLRSEAAKLGHVHAFVSHSWHDDAQAKWIALQSWRRSFRDEYSHEALIWFDRCCIDQTDIETDLRCLPIFLGGCQKLVILCGPSYCSRLWCVMEIFSYIMIGGSIDKIELVPVLRVGKERADMDGIALSFDDFDVVNCKCFDPKDMERILLVIRTAFGRVGVFNERVAEMLNKIQYSDDANTDLGLAYAPVATTIGGQDAID